ncbi:hypothetical protein QM012_001552 [Aureobasidium pullulans]|uniref:F-box domain-containing protein n=1 Tax=Aureobasidium pullulans TaxID=5580 RepID=A0ABR0TEN4_AURPU
MQLAQTADSLERLTLMMPEYDKATTLDLRSFDKLHHLRVDMEFLRAPPQFSRLRAIKLYALEDDYEELRTQLGDSRLRAQGLRLMLKIKEEPSHNHSWWWYGNPDSDSDLDSDQESDPDGEVEVDEDEDDDSGV